MASSSVFLRASCVLGWLFTASGLLGTTWHERRIPNPRKDEDMVHDGTICTGWVAMSTTAPVRLTKVEDLWLQAGWLLIAFAIAVLVGVSERVFTIASKLPEKKKSEEIKASRLSQVLGGQGRLGFTLDCSIVSLALLNFYVFAVATEHMRSTSHVCGFVGNPFSDNLKVMKVSVVAFSLITLARLWSSRCHPHWGRFGRGAFLHHMFGCPFMFIELYILGCAAVRLRDFEEGREGSLRTTSSATPDNYLSFFIFRSMQMLERVPLGLGVESMRKILVKDGKLLSTTFMLGLVLWLTMSSLYYSFNEGSYNDCGSDRSCVWKVVRFMYPNSDTYEPWRKFSSIPSTMWFVLINLVREFPLADAHVTIMQRLLCVVVTFVLTPFFGLPTSILQYGVLQARTEEFEGQLAQKLTNSPDESRKYDPQFGPFLTSWLSFGSIFVFYIYTARGQPEAVLFGVNIEVNPLTLMLADTIVSFLFAVEWILHLVFLKFAYVNTASFLIDLAAFAPGFVHTALYLSRQGVVLGERGAMVDDWICACCVLRVFKIERYLHSWEDIGFILTKARRLLTATGLISILSVIFFSTVLWKTELRNPDASMQEVYGSIERAVWAEIINLHGEWPWPDYTVAGKGVGTWIAILGAMVFCLPISIFGDSLRHRIESETQADETFDKRQWQAKCRPDKYGVRQQVYDLFYAHYHQGRIISIPELGVDGSRLDDVITFTDGAKWVRETRTKNAADFGGTWLQSRDGHITSHKYVVTQKGSSISIALDGNILIGTVNNELKLSFHFLRMLSLTVVIVNILVTLVLTVSTNKLEENFFLSIDAVRELAWALDVFAVMYFFVEFVFRLLATDWRHVYSFIGLCDVISLIALGYSCLKDKRKVMFDEASRTSACYIVLFRLFRIFSPESYISAIQVVKNVIRINQMSLIRSGSTLMSIWVMYTVLLYLSEKPIPLNSATELVTTCEKTTPQRYRNCIAASSLSIIHLFGDYPVTEYNFPSMCVHSIAIFAGIGILGVFNGVFSSSFIEYLKADREKERIQNIQNRINTMTQVAKMIQRAYRRFKQATNKETLTARKDMARKSGGWKIFCRNVVDNRRAYGKGLGLFFNFVLVINVLSTILSTLDGLKEFGIDLDMFAKFEVVCTYIFTFEYAVKVTAAKDKFSFERVVDLVCIIPGWMFWFAVWLAQARSTGKQYTSSADDEIQRFSSLVQTIRGVANFGLCFRAFRILDFRYFRMEWNLIRRSVSKALGNLMVPTYLSVTVWIMASGLYMLLEHVYKHECCPEDALSCPCPCGAAEYMTSVPAAMYWSAFFLVGEWAIVDFTVPAQRLCIIYVLFGIVLVSIPIGILVEAVESTMRAKADESAGIKEILHQMKLINEAEKDDAYQAELERARQDAAEVEAQLAEKAEKARRETLDERLSAGRLSAGSRPFASDDTGDRRPSSTAPERKLEKKPTPALDTGVKRISSSKDRSADQSERKPRERTISSASAGDSGPSLPIPRKLDKRSSDDKLEKESGADQ